ncbi:response regulator transcription factor [Paenibacillus alginolyticus]|uniref:Response regulator transcription factor n=1 Tax=Paenibacillus alginolyticus TaxID=59839 RepID=A0ABT4G7K8_9BACL|nr:MULTISPECIES: response regulator transcription factor [Paenibacillus]MCY9665320.1 response regulator transcription factor [Paenibacillus alginolyticus]MCY9692118.1 response regulator transcription factor [Paenibacillus alginolyticus]MEC0147884.1 response regulator transcription factor [Paenibacillus alginolyticus]SDO68906.1 DNA-binding response regulator, OmpR family, contains REC and winged-helix (wHTH) domain [Paenibacillus sp. yr247]
MAGETILVVDDEQEIVQLIQLYLAREGYKVISANNGQDVFEIVKEHKPDLIILDILLPGLDGIEVCRQLRKTSNTPILFISCKSEDIDIILGLSMGGDDYMTKPFSPSQLVARVKAHLRRNSIREQHQDDPQLVKFPGLEIDLVSHIVRVNGQTISLSAKEFDLLSLMAKTPNRVYKIEHLFELIWSLDSMGDPRTLIVHISNLRKKIESNPAEPRYIITVRGVGYKFNGSAV